MRPGRRSRICAAVQASSKESGGLFVAQNGLSDATLYKWKAKYGGMTVSELRRLKELEAENAELKRLLADAMLDNAGLKGLLAKNS